MTPRVSLVVPTRNRRSTLEHVLPTLAAQSCDPDDYEVLVCDYGSTDGTAALVASMNRPAFRLVTTDRPGRSAGRNAGLAEAQGTLVLFTDADILADTNLVREHLRAHTANPGCAVVGCEVRVDSLQEYADAVRDPAARRHPHRATRRTLPWWFFVTGNASAPRDALVRVDGFDESFAAYGHEDLELGYRLTRSGLRIRHHPAAVNYHWHPESVSERAAKMRLAGVSTVRFYRKHRDWRILARMGVNPFSLAWHRLVAENGRLLRALVARADRSRVCRSVVLEHAYLCGVKAALAGRAEGEAA